MIIRHKTAVEWLKEIYEKGYLIPKSFELAKEIEQDQEKTIVIGTFIQIKMGEHKLPYGKDYTDLLHQAEKEAKEFYDKYYGN